MSEHRNATLARALTAHDAGDLTQAQAIYRSLLASEPSDFQPNFFLALATMQLGVHADAADLLSRSLSVGPSDSGAWNYLCLAKLELNDALGAAVAGGRSAVCEELSEDAHYNLGVALRASHDHASAIDSFLKAATLNPGAWKTFTNLGLCYRALNESLLGQAALLKAICTAPLEIGPRFNLGALLQERGALVEALEMYASTCDCIRLHDPRHAHLADVFRNRGIVLTTMGRPEEGRRWLSKSICLAPAAVLCLNNYGNSLKETASLAEAAAAYERALIIDPGHAEALWNKALLLLLTGKIGEGFKLYESRWRIPELFPSMREFASPRYRGCEPVSGRHIFLYAEQGLGDTMQFSRFSRRLVELGAKVTLEVPDALMGLMRQSNVASEVVRRGEVEPTADFQCPLMSLPAAWSLDEAALNMSGPYLFATPDRVFKWSEIIARDIDVLNVGICWRGSARYRGDATRSFGPERFTSLARRPDIVLYSLQQSDALEQARLAELGIAYFDEDFDSDGAFLDSIAILEHLDLVITSDTAIAHLAAAAGKATWILLAHVPDWRWMLDRNFSPWYPTVRLFRQSSPGDWEAVFLEVERALTEWPRRSG